MNKKEKQLAMQAEIQEKRKLQKEASVTSFPLCDETGTIKGVARTMLEQIPSALSAHPRIISARWNDIEKQIRHKSGPFVVALEFCPLYTAGTTLTESTLVQNAQTDESIQKSRVGAKWEASKLAVSAIQDVCKKSGRQLILQVTFADIGVMVAKRSDANAHLVKQHEKLYKESMQRFCDENGITLKFRKLSDLLPASRNRTVQQFIIAENGQELVQRPPLEDIAPMLDIPISSSRLRKRAEVLLRLLDGCNGNIDLWRGLVHTYINYQPTQNCDMHIGVERSENLLALQVLPSNSDVAQIPKLNIIVT